MCQSLVGLKAAGRLRGVHMGGRRSEGVMRRWRRMEKEEEEEEDDGEA